MPARVALDTANFNRMMQQAAVKWADDMGRRVVAAAKDRAPVDEGRLRASITHTVEVGPTSVVLRVGSPLPYARYVEEGTGIHGPKHARIYPKTKQALKFKAGRQMGPLRQGQKRAAKTKRPFVIVRSVAGSPPNPFLKDALASVFGQGNVRENRSG